MTQLESVARSTRFKESAHCAQQNDLRNRDISLLSQQIFQLLPRSTAAVDKRCHLVADRKPSPLVAAYWTRKSTASSRSSASTTQQHAGTLTTRPRAGRACSRSYKSGLRRIREEQGIRQEAESKLSRDTGSY
eukprot:3484460-Pleurochrysis_carterae.AAC.2